LVFLYKRIQDVVGRNRWFCLHETFYSTNRVLPLSRFKPRARMCSHLVRTALCTLAAELV